MKMAAVLLLLSCLLIQSALAFVPAIGKHAAQPVHPQLVRRNIPNTLQMNFFGDAFRFFTNMNKEASAKHILLKGDDASSKLLAVKEELQQAEDLSAAFSEMAVKISECPSASRGGNLGTFKPGMMVKEFDEVVFGEAVGKVHGPVKTQFGSHLILITRRFEGEKEELMSK